MTFHGGETSVPFLGEGEIKKHFSVAANQEKKMETEKTHQHTDKPAPTQANKPSASAGGFPEDDINKLMSFGFPRQQCLDALKMCGGNVEMAASVLFQG